MNYALQFLALLAAPSLVQEEGFRGLAVGDRIQVTFRSGGTLTGQIVAGPPGRKRPEPAAEPGKPADIDLSKEKEITLDLSWEYPGLNGTMTIPKREIKDVRKLQNLDPVTLERLRAEKRKIESQLAAQNAERRAAERKRDEEALELIRKEEKRKRDLEALAAKKGSTADKLDRLKKGLELLDKYPTSDWGADRLKDIARRAAAKQPVTPEEQNFIQSYDVIQDARNATTPDTTKGPDTNQEKPPEEKKP